MKRGGGLRHGSTATSSRPNPAARFRPSRVTILACPEGRPLRAALPGNASR